ncbi:GNAT family N-acetyltransferase [Massilia sp. CF038]|uniref:GNAT family N-acetyltransferase n=1 Tax=Massilia sp. CF038 TaxID=1881045 RepID=UPI00091DA9EC|nr:GNAT family N-acetyltransferase [Massilia sp. CF038]SHH47293.1 Protein N-acetyltransferase, RimJ/RimL family [Massilia sp. CF038]
MASPITIRKTVRDDLDRFFVYLNDHLSDNGLGNTAKFMPISHAEAGFPPEKEAAFRIGMETPVGQLGWRRGWIALTPDGQIAGHIDLRARLEKAAAHRCLLGMGVHRDFRQQGLGAAMVAVAVAWARSQSIEWIDLDVLSVNHAARNLYLRCGFSELGEIEDMFRIDGESLGHTFMALRLA